MVFGGVVDERLLNVVASGEGTNVLDMFTHHDESRNNSVHLREVTQQVTLVHGAVDSFYLREWRCSTTTNSLTFSALVLPPSLFDCKT